MREEIGKLFPKEVRNLLEKAELKQEYLQEIRLRINGPLLVVYRGEEYFLGAKGGLCKDPFADAVFRKHWNIFPAIPSMLMRKKYGRAI